jgi:hypothetical protein
VQKSANHLWRKNIRTCNGHDILLDSYLNERLEEKYQTGHGVEHAKEHNQEDG